MRFCSIFFVTILTSSWGELWDGHYASSTHELTREVSYKAMHKINGTRQRDLYVNDCTSICYFVQSEHVELILGI